jgi:hypothetical protein
VDFISRIIDFAWGSKHLLLQIKQWRLYFYRQHNHSRVSWLFVIWIIQAQMYQVVLYDCNNARCVFLCVFIWHFRQSLFCSKCLCILISLHMQCIHKLHHLCTLWMLCESLKQILWLVGYWGHMLLSQAVYVWTYGIVDKQPMHIAISQVYTWTATVKQAYMLCVCQL